jgi:hypothetical protein
MYTCRNQPCGEKWQASDLEFKNEGQGFFFRCPLCASRNKVVEHLDADGARSYVQERA